MNTLQAILNTMKLIETKGDSTILMARCLEALNNYIAEMSATPDQANE